MTWNPILYSLSGLMLERNIISFVKATQTDAHAWAKSILSFAGTVPDYKEVFNSSEGRVRDLFPNLMLVARKTTFEETEDNHSLLVTHSFGFESEVVDADPEVLTEKTSVYGVALQSMLLNIPRANLINGLSTNMAPTVTVVSFDRDQTRRMGSMYLQSPRLVANVRLLEITP